VEALPMLMLYDMVVVDEISLLDRPQFERIHRLWAVAGKVPALVFIGDKFQLPGMGDTRPWDSALWRQPACQHLRLFESWRCKEANFQETLDALRTSRPSKRRLRRICAGHMAWTGKGLPLPRQLRQLFFAHPETQIVTCTRRRAAELNDIALEATFGRKEAVVVLEGDVEMNPENYLDGKLYEDRPLKPTPVKIFKGMKLFLTKNLRKADDFVNGMEVEVEAYHPRERMLRVMTKTNQRLDITPWTDVLHGSVVIYPIRLGYASTIHKAQGDEFKHITICLDVKGMQAAGYTALSRVSRACDYCLGGSVKTSHFTPVWNA
jgi:ATP-dependent exoDNAse (exonuclease V) alpha subunit